MRRLAILLVLLGTPAWAQSGNATGVNWGPGPQGAMGVSPVHTSQTITDWPPNTFVTLGDGTLLPSLRCGWQAVVPLPGPVATPVSTLIWTLIIDGPPLLLEPGMDLRVDSYVPYGEGFIHHVWIGHVEPGPTAVNNLLFVWERCILSNE